MISRTVGNEMEIVTRFNRKKIQDRQIDTLIGLSKGLCADGKVHQAETEFLLSWLIQNQQASDNPLIIHLLEKVSLMLEEGVLDDEESAECLKMLCTLSGEASEIDELGQTSLLSVNEPHPIIAFDGVSFLFTGTCAFGTRKQCQAVIE